MLPGSIVSQRIQVSSRTAAELHVAERCIATLAVWCSDFPEMARNSDTRSMHGDGNEAIDMACESGNCLACDYVKKNKPNPTAKRAMPSLVSSLVAVRVF
jgi:hypothetical protein